MSLESYLISLGRLYRGTGSLDAVGGHVRSMSLVAEFSCMVQPTIGKTQDGYDYDAGKRRVDTTHVVYTTAAIEAEPGDRLDVDGVSYVVRHAANHAGRGVLFAIYCDRITG